MDNRLPEADEQNLYEKECLICGYHVVTRSAWSRWVRYLPHEAIKLSVRHRRRYDEWRSGLSLPSSPRRGAV